MNHSASIRHEFDKIAETLKQAVWDELGRSRQQRYLHRHPKSRFRVTAPAETTGEKCTHCNTPLRIKDHGDWEGYHCPGCGQGGSRNKKRHQESLRQRRQFNQEFPRKPVDPEVENTRKQMNIPAIVEARAPIVNIKPEQFDKKTKTFSMELSDMGDEATIARILYLRNPKTGAKVKFHRVSEDTDSTREDTYGYNYENENRTLKLLIIND